MPTSAQLCALLALPLAAASLVAQSSVRPARCAGGAVAATLPGSLTEEMDRARGLRSGAPWSLTRGQTDGIKARMLADSNPAALRVAGVLPEVLVTSQQAFPLPANDGPMWAGKGLTYSITGGIAICGRNARWGAIIAPTYWYAENAEFPLPDNPEYVPELRRDHSPWASPYHYMPRSLDAPRRFGPTALRAFDPGALALWYRAPRVEAGFTTESEWLGPGQHNALLLSSQAAGIPRVYVRTSRPIQAAGELDVRYSIGGLTWSDYFFETMDDSTRTIAQLSLTWRPKFEPNLTVGTARMVMTPIMGNTWLKHLLSPLIDAGTPNARPYWDKTQVPGRDQLFTLFANWRLPDDGAEIWAEWARAEFPTSLKDFIESPNHTQALTLGLQHTRPVGGRGLLARLGVEYSQTNQSSTYRERPVGSWYTSRAVQGGFTQRGQVLGAMIGPGSVTQRLGLDLIGAKRSLGAFAYRIKWDDDAFYTIPRPYGNGLCKHDVSLAWGLRGTALTPAGWFEGTVTAQNRLNLYYQATGFCFTPDETHVDQRNLSLEFRFHPRVR